MLKENFLVESYKLFYHATLNKTQYLTPSISRKPPRNPCSSLQLKSPGTQVWSDAWFFAFILNQSKPSKENWKSNATDLNHTCWKSFWSKSSNHISCILILPSRFSGYMVDAGLALTDGLQWSPYGQSSTLTEIKKKIKMGTSWGSWSIRQIITEILALVSYWEYGINSASRWWVLEWQKKSRKTHLWPLQDLRVPTTKGM